jgi:hypothetical protein
MEVLNRKATETPVRIDQLRDDVSPQLADVIARSLSRNPAGRQQTMGELADDIERARPDRRRRAGREPDSGRAPTPAEPAAPATVAPALVAAAPSAPAVPAAAGPTSVL